MTSVLGVKADPVLSWVDCTGATHPIWYVWYADMYSVMYD